VLSDGGAEFSRAIAKVARELLVAREAKTSGGRRWLRSWAKVT
jgi:hypothetical protein